MFDLRKAALLAGAALALGTPAAAAGDAAAGLQAMRETNLIVLGNMTGGHDVEGNLFVGGSLSGNAMTVGFGNIAQGMTASSRPTMTVGGDMTALVNYQPGANVSSANAILIGGNFGSANFNTPGARIDVGGNFGGNLNLANGQVVNIGGSVTGSVNGSNNTQTVKAGGSITGNANGATFLANQGIGWNAADTSVKIASETLKLTQDLQALSTALASLNLAGNPSDVTTFNDGGQLDRTFNAVAGSNGYALFSISSDLLATSRNIDFNVAAGAYPIIVNVTGTDVVWNANAVGGYNSSVNQRIIWNFTEATSIDFKKMVHGSILAVQAAAKNSTPLEGSVAVKSFDQGGEVHLGTYNGGDGFLTGVPEPSTWAFMIGGFGLVGSALRRRRGLAAA